MRAGFLGILFLLLAGCQKSAPKQNLPQISDIGEHTLGFHLNHAPWIPFDRGLYEEFELPRPYFTKGGGIKIAATRIDEKNYCRNWFCIEVAQGAFQAGRYEISNHICKAPYQTYYYGINKDKPSVTYDIDTLSPHYINFSKIDTLNHVVAGTFEFNAISSLNDTLEFRNGRFDLQLEK